MPASAEDLAMFEDDAPAAPRASAEDLAMFDDAPVQAPAKEPGILERWLNFDKEKALLMGAGQGALAGFADEAAGGTGAVLSKLTGEEGSWADLYRKNRDHARKMHDDVSEESPLSYGAGNLLGGVALGKKLGGGKLAAAGLGGLIGVGSSDDDLTKMQAGDALGDIGEDAATGAAIGGGLALAPGAIRGGGKLLGKGLQLPARALQKFDVPLQEQPWWSKFANAVGGKLAGAPKPPPAPAPPAAPISDFEQFMAQHGDDIGAGVKTAAPRAPASVGVAPPPAQPKPLPDIGAGIAPAVSRGPATVGLAPPPAQDITRNLRLTNPGEVTRKLTPPAPTASKPIVPVPDPITQKPMVAPAPPRPSAPDPVDVAPVDAAIEGAEREAWVRAQALAKMADRQPGPPRGMRNLDNFLAGKPLEQPKTFADRYDDTGFLRQMTPDDSGLWPMGLGKPIPSAADDVSFDFGANVAGPVGAPPRVGLPAKGKAFDKILGAGGIDDYDAARADAAYKAFLAGQGPRPPPFEGGHFDEINRLLDLKGASRVSGGREAFDKMTKGVRDWQTVEDDVLSKIQRVPGLENARLSDTVRERLLDALAKGRR